MPCFDCDEQILMEVLNDAIKCLIHGGFRVAYWTTYDQVDWANTTLTDGKITAFAMNEGGLFYKVQSDVKFSTFNSEYTEANQFYTDNVLMQFESLQNREAVQSAISSGCLVLLIFDNNCLQWVYGVSHDGTNFVKPIKTLRVARNRIDGGQLAGTLAHLELDLIGESFCGPLEADIEESAVPIVAAP